MDIQATLMQAVFYLFSILLIFSSVMVITANNTVKSVLFLILAFVACAGLWILLEAEFLALILVIVYVGAVMTLFLFVVMMLNLGETKASFKHLFRRYAFFAVVIAIMVAVMVLVVVGPERFGLDNFKQSSSVVAEYSNVKVLGTVLYTDYVLPFEMAAILLFIAMIAAISLVHRPPQARKNQIIADQLNIRREDRVRIVKMASTKPRRKDKEGS